MEGNIDILPWERVLLEVSAAAGLLISIRLVVVTGFASASSLGYASHAFSQYCVSHILSFLLCIMCLQVMLTCMVNNLKL